jgi:hypothetical protein
MVLRVRGEPNEAHASPKRSLRATARSAKLAVPAGADFASESQDTSIADGERRRFIARAGAAFDSQLQRERVGRSGLPSAFVGRGRAHA